MDLLREEHGIEPAEALERATQKLIRRHPHVYGDARVEGGEAAYRQWQEIKRAEKGEGGAAGTRSLLGEQPKGLPALVAAFRIQEKAGAVGFDWPDVAGAMAKMREEVGELEHAIGAPSDPAPDITPALASEVGDLLFAVVNVARHLGVDPERELRAALHRFRDRFHHIERRLEEKGSSPSAASLEEMDTLWEEAKTLARSRATGETPKP